MQAVPDAKDDVVYHQWAVFWEVIASLIGRDWALRNMNPVGGALYFRMSAAENSLDAYVRQHRVIQLGSQLYDLQDLPSFNSLARDLRTRSLLGACSELTVAQMLSRAGHKVRFIRPRGVKRSDFDLAVVYGGFEISVEVKAKEEETAYTKATLLASIKSARLQLPRSGPGIVLIRLPTAWTTDYRFIREVDEIVQSAFRNSSRINGIIFLWEEWVRATPQGLACLLKYRQYDSPSPKTPVPGIERLLRGRRTTPSLGL